jgi:hypothetical protein
MSYFLHKGCKKYDIIVVHVLVKIKILLKDKMHGEYNVKYDSLIFQPIASNESSGITTSLHLDLLIRLIS